MFLAMFESEISVSTYSKINSVFDNMKLNLEYL